MNKHCIRLSIVALAATAFGLVSVAGPAQALAESGSTTVSSTVTVPGGTAATVSVTVAPDDSTWD